MDHICCIKCDKIYLDILSKGGIRLLMNEYGSVSTSHFDGNVSLFIIMIGPMHESEIIYGMNVNSTFHIDEFFSPFFKIAPIHDPTNVRNHVAFDGRDILCCDGCSHALHIKCDPLPIIPRDTRYCRYCQNVFQKEDFVKHSAIVEEARSKFVDPDSNQRFDPFSQIMGCGKVLGSSWCSIFKMLWSTGLVADFLS